VVVQLPNVIEFVTSISRVQKIGCIPIAPSLRTAFSKLSQFAKLSGERWRYPDRHGDFDFTEMVRRVRREAESLKFGIVLATLRHFLPLPS